MQISPAPITWTEVFRLLIATSIGLIPFLVTTYRNRKKSDLENKEIEARAELARVNARSTEFRDNIAAGEGVGKLLSALIEAGDTIHELQGKNFQLEQDKLGEDMLRLDLKKAIALLAFHSIPFHTAEHQDVKKMVEAYENLAKRRSKS